MSSALDIQIVSHPNLEKIENFFKDASYRETIEFSANFNTRLGLERRTRLPFLDPQTGVAQNHSQLFMDKRQRMPGFRQGQIYTYPAARWRKSRRQYLSKMYRFPERPFQSLRKEQDALSALTNAVNVPTPVLSHNTVISMGTASPTVSNSAPSLDVDFSMTLHDESSSLGVAGGDTSDSKDSQQLPHHFPSQQQQQSHPPAQQQQHHQLKEELSKEWFYDEIDMNDMDSLEDPKSPADDEYDYDPRYGTKKRRKRTTPRKRNSGESGTRKRSGGARGRASASADTSLNVSLESIDGAAVAETSATPTASVGRRPRGSGTRGRRRTKNTPANACDPPSPHLHAEPPSFASAAAAVGVPDIAGRVAEEHADLRNYRKYL